MTKSEFIKNASSAYKSAYACGWIEDICIHMKKGKISIKEWTYDEMVSEKRLLY